MENNEIKEETITATKQRLNIPSAIVLAGVIIAAAVFLKGAQPAAKATTDSGDKLDLVAEVTEDDFVRGEKSAPVTLIEYADFSCHFCADFQLTLKKLVDESAGKIKWVYRHLPIFNIEAAVASTCVGRLGGDDAFWQYADTLFTNRDKFGTSYYKKLAIDLNIKESEYDECVNNPETERVIKADFTQKRTLLGFNGTPHMVLIDKNGKKFSITGALQYEELKSVIDSLDN